MKQISIENFLKHTPQVPQFSSKNTNYLIAGANPIYYLDDGSQEEQVGPLAASIDWQQISPKILDSFNTGQNSVSGIYGILTYAQSFTNVTETTLSGAKLDLKTFGSPTGTIYATVYSHTGTYGTSSKPLTALATSDGVDIATALTSSLSLVTFNFSGVNRISLTANTYYVIRLSIGVGSTNSSNQIQIGFNSGGGASGNSAYSADGINWTPLSQDMIFYVYGGIANGVNFDGNIVHTVSSTNSTYSIYVITDTCHVYGITTTSITDLGYPFGSSISDLGAQLSIGGSSLFCSSSSQANIYKTPLPGTSSTWTACVTSVNYNAGSHLMEPFLDFIALVDPLTIGTTGRLIKNINTTAFTISSGIDIGIGWGIMRIRNYNNKYLAIAAGKTNTGGITDGYSQNYIFLWDGISSRYNYSVKVPGQFIDMKVIDSILYVAVKVASGKTCLFYLVNTSLRKVLTTQLSSISTYVHSVMNCSLFDFRNYVGINLATFSGLTNPVMVYGKDEIGEIEFIHSSGRVFDQFQVGYDGNLFSSEYVNGGNSNLYYLPSSGTYQTILYKSQWIPVDNLQGLDIYYETPPSSGTDSINVTIYGQGEDIITGSSTTVLSSITPTNYLTAKRTRLDCQGFTGDQLKIQLSTVNSTWRPIIRAVVPITK